MDCGQTAKRIAFIMGTQFGAGHKNIVFDGHPKIGELDAPKILGQWEGLGKFQAIVMKFCTATTLAQETCLPNFSAIAPK